MIINFDEVTGENTQEHNLGWPQIPDHPYRILILNASENNGDEKNKHGKIALSATTKLNGIEKIFKALTDCSIYQPGGVYPSDSDGTKLHPTKRKHQRKIQSDG